MKTFFRRLWAFLRLDWSRLNVLMVVPGDLVVITVSTKTMPEAIELLSQKFREAGVEPLIVRADITSITAIRGETFA